MKEKDNDREEEDEEEGRGEGKALDCGGERQARRWCITANDCNPLLHF